jgi:hypothetical protein
MVDRKKVSEAVDILLGHKKPMSEDVIPQGEVPFKVTKDVIMALAWHHLQDADEAMQTGSDQVFEASIKDIRELFDDDMVKEDEELRTYVQEQLDAAEALEPKAEGEEEPPAAPEEPEEEPEEELEIPEEPAEEEEAL